jgi:hypothetical protein
MDIEMWGEPFITIYLSFLKPVMVNSAPSGLYTKVAGGGLFK